MEVSIIVIGYNGQKYLNDAFDSLLNQDFSGNYEIIYIDNNSTDNSCLIAEEYEKKNIDFRVIKNKINSGFAAGNNIGIRISKAKYIALFNQDAIADKEWLKKLVSAMEKDKRTGATGGKIYYYNSSDIYFGGGKIYYGGLCWVWSLNEKEGLCDYVSGCAMLVRKDVLDTIGALDEYLFTYYEETDLCTRIKNAGYKINYIPEAVSWHNTPRKSKRPSRYITYYMHRNRVIYCYKNYAHKKLFFFIDIIILYNFFSFYELIRVPSSMRFIREVIKARIDSIEYFFREINE